MTMNSTSHNSIAERFGRWLGRGWGGYVRCEQQISCWFVDQGMPVRVAFALLWIAKLTLLGLLLYTAFWLALLLIFVVAAALMANSAGISDEPPKPEWRNGPAGFGLYTYDGFRIDPHIDDD
ncbi:DUF3742 family protein [Pectobacterium brasiliense]|uniref:DUF3742 family protein n=1 Tax=Pectobacterium brasiliense TaxID=180957 RepID=UPI001F0A1DCA|nr:DUF3742 family protein [Pectobacterium brasiliense]